MILLGVSEVSSADDYRFVYLISRDGAIMSCMQTLAYNAECINDMIKCKKYIGYHVIKLCREVLTRNGVIIRHMPPQLYGEIPREAIVAIMRVH